MSGEPRRPAPPGSTAHGSPGDRDRPARRWCCRNMSGVSFRKPHPAAPGKGGSEHDSSRMPKTPAVTPVNPEGAGRIKPGLLLFRARTRRSRSPQKRARGRSGSRTTASCLSRRRAPAFVGQGCATRSPRQSRRGSLAEGRGTGAAARPRVTIGSCMTTGTVRRPTSATWPASGRCSGADGASWMLSMQCVHPSLPPRHSTRIWPSDGPWPGSVG